jgi:hypothetical protein
VQTPPNTRRYGQAIRLAQDDYGPNCSDPVTGPIIETRRDATRFFNTTRIALPRFSVTFFVKY